VSQAVVIEGLGKRYHKLDERPTLLGSLLPFRRVHRSDLWALRDVDLRIDRGDTVGVIGRNGSGKTTLLKILGGVTRPTTGHIRVVGRLAALIGVGVGFRNEMTGRENVYLNGALLGLEREQIDERFADIVSFAELSDFIDTPVKFYSSGMFLRLGFAIAIHASPDIFLLDEILAVGDLAFQAKCVERMRAIQETGTTIVFVSHSMHAVRQLCSRAVLLRNGRIDTAGNTEHVIARYHELLSLDGGADMEQIRSGADQIFLGGARFLERQLLGRDGPVNFAKGGVPIELRARIRFDCDIDSPMVGMQVINEDGTLVYGKHSWLGLEYQRFSAGEETQVSVRFTPRLGGGSYRARLWMTTRDGRGLLLTDDGGMHFFVEPSVTENGVADLEGSVHVGEHAVDGPPNLEPRIGAG
jgi:ABC-2 type transport system ATP-binding protein